MYTSFLKHRMERPEISIYRNLVRCTQYDNCESIQAALRSIFPNTITRNCLFRVIQNNHRKREAWSINTYPDLTKKARATWIRKRKDELDARSRDVLN